MDEYQTVHSIFLLSREFSKNFSLYYPLGISLGHSPNELMLILLYLNFNYKLGFYTILMNKYLDIVSIQHFKILLHQTMLEMGMSNYYFQTLKKLNLFNLLWPDYPVPRPQEQTRNIETPNTNLPSQ